MEYYLLSVATIENQEILSFIYRLKSSKIRRVINFKKSAKNIWRRK